MKTKKDPTKKQDKGEMTDGETFGQILSKADLKSFLMNVRDRMGEAIAAPIYVLSAMNFVLNQPGIYEWLDNENKEIARDIWLRLKQSGLQLRNPPLLFGSDEEDLAATSA